jgi:hypothetical protein
VLRVAFNRCESTGQLRTVAEHGRMFPMPLQELL